MLFMAWLFSVTASIPQVSLLYPRQQRNGGPPVVHYRIPPITSGGPPHGCPFDTGRPTSYIVCGGGPPVIYQWQIPSSDYRLRTTGGLPVAFFAAHSHWWTTGVMLMLEGYC